MSVEAATSTPVFLAFLDHVLLPELARRPGATVVMDNLAPHKAEAVRERIEGAGLKLRFLPRYSPDLSPIEPCWSKIKALLRAREARSVDALDRELPGVLDAVSARDARGWFRPAGHALPANRDANRFICRRHGGRPPGPERGSRGCARAGLRRSLRARAQPSAPRPCRLGRASATAADPAPPRTANHPPPASPRTTSWVATPGRALGQSRGLLWRAFSP